MKLVTYSATGATSDRRAGVVQEGLVFDAGASVRRLLAASGSLPEVAARAMAGRPVGSFDEMSLGPPVPDPDKVIGIGFNYAAHRDDLKSPPEVPVLFAKFRNALIGTEVPIELPADSTSVDYEGELAVVIGRRCRHVAEVDALAAVAGYMPFNDVTARDLQQQTGQWTAGKTPDTFAPCGPALVTADEVGDPHALTLVTRLNGKTVQRAGTGEMIFSVAATIAFVSRLMTLEPGDIIATGTPDGVGVSRTPPLYLQPGDLVEVEIPRLGTLRSPVVAGSGGETELPMEMTIAARAEEDGHA